MTSDLVFESQQLFTAQFEALINNPLLSDITFVVGDEKQPIHAHKLVLAARSAVFRGMFDTPMKESKQKEFFIDATYEAFFSVIQYIYSGKILVNAEQLPEVLNLANYYDLSVLKSSCSSRLEKGLNESNVCSALSIAALYKESALKKQALQYIACHTEEVLSSENFYTLPEPVLVKMLKKSDVLIAPEEKIFEAVVAWGKAQLSIETSENEDEENNKEFSDNESDDEYQDKLKEAIQHVVEHIRFPLMTPEFLDTIESMKLVDNKFLEQAREFHSKKTSSLVDWRKFEARKSSVQQPVQKTPFDFLVNYPQFTMLKDIIKQNPKLLDPVLSELKKSNPELGNFIANNRQEFLLLFQ